MLEKDAEALLCALKKICPAGGYKVVSSEEIEAKTENSTPVSKAEAERLLVLLDERGFINLRFSEGGEYCFTVLPRGYEYETQSAKSGVYLRNKAFLKTFAGVFVGAFLGAFLGGIIAGLII